MDNDEKKGKVRSSVPEPPAPGCFLRNRGSHVEVSSTACGKPGARLRVRRQIQKANLVLLHQVLLDVLEGTGSQLSLIHI